MVTVRDGKMEQQQKQLAFLLQRSKDSAMFKVPSSQPASSASSSFQADAAKRKWQDAFPHPTEPANTRLGLSTTERPQQRQKLPPLTIFYAGTVNVYDNVPENMVRALMTLAAARSSRPAVQAVLNHIQKNNNINKSSNSSSNGYVFPGFQQVNHNVNHKFSSSNNGVNNENKGFTFPVFDNTSLSLNSFANNNNNNNKHEEKRSPPLVPTRQQSPSSSPTTSTSTQNASSPDLTKTRMQLLPAGLPQARRASIQRFLEKRKQKQVNNNNNQDEEDAGNISLKPASPEDVNTQVPHFLRRIS